MRQRKKVICKERFLREFEDFEQKGRIQNRDGHLLRPGSQDASACSWSLMIASPKAKLLSHA
jgi:hypothetical protein